MSVADIYYIYPRFWWPHIAFVLPSPGGESRRILRLPPRILQKSFAKSFGCQPPEFQKVILKKSVAARPLLQKRCAVAPPNGAKNDIVLKREVFRRLSPIVQNQCSVPFRRRSAPVKLVLETSASARDGLSVAHLVRCPFCETGSALSVGS